MDDLKRCPFCGNVAYFSELKSGNWSRYSVVCANDRCFASKSSCFGKRYYTKKEAIEAWNRRADECQIG